METTNSLQADHPTAITKESPLLAARIAATERPLVLNEHLVVALADELERRLAPHLMPAPEPEAEYLTLAEVARRTSFSYDFVYDAVRHGHLPAVRKGREWRVAVSDMRAWMNKDRAGVARPTRSVQRERVNRLMPGLSC